MAVHGIASELNRIKKKPVSEIATHRIANKLNRMMSTIARVPSQWRLKHALHAIAQWRYCHDIFRDMRLKHAIL